MIDTNDLPPPTATMADLDLEISDSLSSGPESPAIADNVDDNVMESRPRKKGRERLLRSLKRIPSLPTLAQLGRFKSGSSRPHGLTSSLSCVNLSTSQSPFAQSSYGSYGAPTLAGESSSNPGSRPNTSAAKLSGHDGADTLVNVRQVPSGTMAMSPTISLPVDVKMKKPAFNIWAHLPHEIKIHVLSFLLPRELVKASRTSKEIYGMCFDGQLWTSFDASEFYTKIPADSLAKIIVAAGPFIKDLNLRGCVQVEHYKRAEIMVKSCRNLINATLEGCRNFQRAALHNLLKNNHKLANLNLTGLTVVNNTTCKIIAHSCPQLETFNVSWCKHMDARGLKMVLEGCPQLRDLRAGEIKGFDNHEIAEVLFKTNNLERLVLAGCEDLNDNALRTMIWGTDYEIDVLTDLPIVAPRKLRHLDLSRCSRLTNNGVKALGHFVPDLEGLQLTGIRAVTDEALEPILASTPRLTHLDMEDLVELTNTLLSEHLAKAPCAPNLQHLSISYCENIGDAGMIPVLRSCTSLRSVDMDNTRISDLALAEAAAMVRSRTGRLLSGPPRVGLSMVVYDCQNVTWTGVREVLSRNTERQMVKSGSTVVTVGPSYPAEVIALKCFYGWQMTVDEHTKRVLRADLSSASRLERKWANYIQANEEAGVTGAGGRRRRRRAREAQQVHADEEDGDVGVGGRRRSRTTACAIM